MHSFIINVLDLDNLAGLHQLSKKLMRDRDFHKKKAIKLNLRYHWSKYQNLRNIVNIEMK